MQALQELSDRLRPVSEHLKRFQRHPVCAVASQVHVALVAALVVLMQWPDIHLPVRFLTGFRALGEVKASGVFRRVSPRECAEAKESLLRRAETIRAQYESRHRPSEGDDHCVQA